MDMARALVSLSLPPPNPPCDITCAFILYTHTSHTHAGVAYYGTWMTAEKNSDVDAHKWLIMCGQNGDSPNILANGNDVSNGQAGCLLCYLLYLPSALLNNLLYFKDKQVSCCTIYFTC